MFHFTIQNIQVEYSFFAQNYLEMETGSMLTQ